MYFLINYNRQDRKLISIEEFPDSAVAAKAKLEAEIAALACQVKTEIVVLEAEDLESLKCSHGRYFNDLGGIQMEK